MHCSPQGSSVHGLLQTRILEWIAISFSRVSYWPRECHLRSPKYMGVYLFTFCCCSFTCLTKLRSLERIWAPRYLCFEIYCYLIHYLVNNQFWEWAMVLVFKPCPTLATPWTITCQAPLSMGFSRQEYWRRSPFPFPGDLPDPEIKPGSSAFWADSLPTELWGKITVIWGHRNL